MKFVELFTAGAAKPSRRARNITRALAAGMGRARAKFRANASFGWYMLLQRKATTVYIYYVRTTGLWLCGLVKQTKPDEFGLTHFLSASRFVCLDSQTSKPVKIVDRMVFDATMDTQFNEYVKLSDFCSLQGYSRPRAKSEAWALNPFSAEVWGEWLTVDVISLDDASVVPYVLTVDAATRSILVDAFGPQNTYILRDVVCAQIEDRRVVCVRIQSTDEILWVGVICGSDGSDGWDGKSNVPGKAEVLYRRELEPNTSEMFTLETLAHNDAGALFALVREYQESGTSAWVSESYLAVVHAAGDTFDFRGRIVFNDSAITSIGELATAYTYDTFIMFRACIKNAQQSLVYVAFGADGNLSQGVLEPSTTMTPGRGLPAMSTILRPDGSLLTGYMWPAGTQQLTDGVATYFTATYFTVEFGKAKLTLRSVSNYGGFCTPPMLCHDGLYRVVYWGAAFATDTELTTSYPNFYGGVGTTLWELCEDGTAARLTVPTNYQPLGWSAPASLHWSALYYGSTQIGVYASGKDFRVIAIHTMSYAQFVYFKGTSATLLGKALYTIPSGCPGYYGLVCSNEHDVLIFTSRRIVTGLVEDNEHTGIYSLKSGTPKVVAAFDNSGGLVWSIGTVRLSDDGSTAYVQAKKSLISEDTSVEAPGCIVRIYQIDLKTSTAKIMKEYVNIASEPDSPTLYSVHDAASIYTWNRTLDTLGIPIALYTRPFIYTWEVR